MDSTELRQLIFQQVASIPCGKVASYGQIARLCGFPNHARFVGRVMKDLPEHSKIPWHRVVNGQGELLCCSQAEQQARLTQEGVTFYKGKVLRAFFI